MEVPMLKIGTIFCTAFVANVLCVSSSRATLIIDTSLTALPSDPGFSSISLSGAPLGSSAPFTLGTGANAETISFVGVSGSEGVVQGVASGLYAPPIINSAGQTYAGQYFSTGNTGYINIQFSTNRNALALLWGSVDASNEITFLENGKVVGNVFGTNITSNPDGNQGFGGSFYTLINSSVSFNDIELSSGVTSFESAMFEADPANYFVPEPANLALLGAGLAAFACIRRLYI
jgi:hypothetical protein